MKFHFPLNQSWYITIISTYATTFASLDKDKEAFYEDLDQIIRTTPVSHKHIILIDFNTRKGIDSDNWD